MGAVLMPAVLAIVVDLLELFRPTPMVTVGN